MSIKYDTIENLTNHIFNESTQQRGTFIYVTYPENQEYGRSRIYKIMVKVEKTSGEKNEKILILLIEFENYRISNFRTN
jgi:hypothetical protein